MSYFYSANPVLEQQVDHFFDILSEENTLKYGSVLSILLLGSMSRGEATWQTVADGRYQLLSDIEFLTVYPEGFSEFDSFTADLKRASDEAFGTHNLNLFHVDNTFVRKSSLPRMERKLLTYDATVFGRCVVGEDVVPLLPQITIDNINWSDIWDIMTHRVFSVLYYGFPLKRQGMDKEYRYSIAKNSLDLMTVILVSNGRLESGFARRLQMLQEMNVPQKWLDYFDYCLSIKLGVSSEHSYSIVDMEQLFGEILGELVRTFHVPVKNVLRNVKPVLRRRIGMVKRTLSSRHLPPTCKAHLRELIEYYECNNDLDVMKLKDNYALHGYPTKWSDEQ